MTTAALCQAMDAMRRPLLGPEAKLLLVVLADETDAFPFFLPCGGKTLAGLSRRSGLSVDKIERALGELWGDGFLVGPGGEAIDPEKPPRSLSARPPIGPPKLAGSGQTRRPLSPLAERVHAFTVDCHEEVRGQVPLLDNDPMLYARLLNADEADVRFALTELERHGLIITGGIADDDRGAQSLIAFTLAEHEEIDQILYGKKPVNIERADFIGLKVARDALDAAYKTGIQFSILGEAEQIEYAAAVKAFREAAAKVQ
jgi:hypothetical protein